MQVKGNARAEAAAAQHREGLSLSAIPWQARLIVLGAIWGMSFLFIKVGDEALAPLQVALARMLLGTVTLLVILAVRREGLPRSLNVWRHLATVAIVLNVIPFSLFAYGELHTTSVLAGIWNGTTPLFTAPIAVLMLANERLTRDRVAGLLIGFAGVLVILGAWNGFGGSALIGNLLCLGASFSYALGFPYVRKYLAGGTDSTLALAAGQLICGTIELAIITPFLTHAPAGLPLKVVASIVALGVVGTGIAYILNYSVIRDAGATIASTVAYLIPLFSTVAGVVILHETLTWYEPVGAVIVILGVAVTQGRIRIPLASGAVEETEAA